MPALNEAPNVGREYVYGVAPETTYGTPLTGGPALALRCEPVNIDRGINLREIRSSLGGKSPTYDNRIQNMSGSAATFTLEMPMNAYDGSIMSPFELMCKAHFQYINSGVCSYFDTHPTGDGVDYSYTFYRFDPVANRDVIVPGCVNTALDLTWERGETVTMTAEVMGQTGGEINADAGRSHAPSGSSYIADQPPIADFTNWTYTINVNNTGYSDFTLQTLNMHFEHDTVEHLTADGDGQYDNAGFVGRNNCSFTITLLRDAQSALADVALEKGQPIAVKATAGTNLLLFWDMTDIWCSGKIDNVEYNLDPESLVYVTLTCKMLAADADTNMCEIDLN